ncbi:hypothetical protein DICA0_B04412 [Diutina catenulata]
MTSGEDFQTRLMTEELLTRSGTRPLYLTSVEINGGETFSPEFFRKLLGPMLTKSDYTLGQLLQGVSDAQDRLYKTNVFKSIRAGLHSDFARELPEGVTSYNKETSVATKVIFDLASINLNVGEIFFNVNSQDNLNLHLNYLNNNFNDNAEFVNIGVRYNPYKPYDHLITSAKFLAALNNPAFKFLIDVRHGQQNNESWQQSAEASTGGTIGVQYNHGQNFSVVNGVMLAKRTIHSIADGASDDLKFFAGEFLKMSLVNRAVYSGVRYLNPVSKNFPISGVAASLATELSQTQEQPARSPTATFVKSTLGLSAYRSWFDNAVTAELLANVGGIYNFSSGTPVHISDRFYLGGIENLRGFTKNGVSATGGLQFYFISATAFSKLPRFVFESDPTIVSPRDVVYEANPLRLYATTAIGNASKNLLSESSVPLSTGFGVRYFNHWANFDLGYFVAGRLGGGEKANVGVKNGLQFSVSIGGTNRSL